MRSESGSKMGFREMTLVVWGRLRHLMDGARQTKTWSLLPYYKICGWYPQTGETYCCCRPNRFLSPGNKLRKIKWVSIVDINSLHVSTGAFKKPTDKVLRLGFLFIFFSFQLKCMTFSIKFHNSLIRDSVRSDTLLCVICESSLFNMGVFVTHLRMWYVNQRSSIWAF